MTLPMSVRTEGPATVVAVESGAVDVHTAPSLRTELTRVLDSGAARVVVDLDGVDFLDSSALGVLVGVRADLVERHGTLAVVCSAPRLLRVFQITRLDEVLTIVPSVAEALEHV